MVHELFSHNELHILAHIETIFIEWIAHKYNINYLYMENDEQFDLICEKYLHYYNFLGTIFIHTSKYIWFTYFNYKIHIFSFYFLFKYVSMCSNIMSRRFCETDCML
jgi:hypothetical protein